MALALSLGLLAERNQEIRRKRVYNFSLIKYSCVIFATPTLKYLLPLEALSMVFLIRKITISRIYFLS